MIDRKTLTASQLARLLDESVRKYGDLPVYFTDGFFRYGAHCDAECAPNFDAPRAMLVKAFNLETGMNGPDRPLYFRAAGAAS